MAGTIEAGNIRTSNGRVIDTDDIGSIISRLSALEGSQVQISKTEQLQLTGNTTLRTGIPSWAKRITMYWSGVSTTGTGKVGFRFYTNTGVVSSGYYATDTAIGNSSGVTTNTTNGFFMSLSAAANLRNGTFVLTKLYGSNDWVVSGLANVNNNTSSCMITGIVSLSNLATSIELFESGGAAFDAGSVSYVFEELYV